MAVELGEARRGAWQVFFGVFFAAWYFDRLLQAKDVTQALINVSIASVRSAAI